MKGDLFSESSITPFESSVQVESSTMEGDMDLHDVQAAQSEAGVSGVATWLADVEADLEKPQHMNTVATMATPVIKPLAIQQHGLDLLEEISPTDTNFSSNTMFDSPSGPSHSSCVFSRRRYADTDASSLDEEDELHVRKELFASPKLSGTNNPESAPSTSSLEESVGLGPSGFSPKLRPATPATAAESFDPCASRLILLTSCLQCVLCDMPCSRTLPACSRCIRHGNSELCLVQRKRIHREVFCADGSMSTDPLLLVTAEGYSEENFRKKIQLQDEVRTSRDFPVL